MDYQYVAEPGSNVKCMLCMKVAESPWQHIDCGRLLCWSCLEKHGEDKPCPNCRMTGPQYFKDNKSRREIEALLVSCPNAECDEIMERQYLYNHVHAKCPSTPTPCKYKSIGCDVKLKRQDISAHEENDKLHLRLALDTITALRAESLTFKKNDSVTFAIRDFQKRRSMKEVYTSPPFYTHAKGYCMELRIKANGAGKFEGTHVAIGVRLLSGKYDSVLKWPFAGKVSFTLLNQLQDANHHSETLIVDESANVRVTNGHGMALISHSELDYDPINNTQYLKDDTLYIRVLVEVAGRRHWLE